MEAPGLVDRRTPGSPHCGHFQVWEGPSSIWAVMAGEDSLLYNILKYRVSGPVGH